MKNILAGVRKGDYRDRDLSINQTTSIICRSVNFSCSANFFSVFAGFFTAGNSFVVLLNTDLKT